MTLEVENCACIRFSQHGFHADDLAAAEREQHEHLHVALDAAHCSRAVLRDSDEHRVTEDLEIVRFEHDVLPLLEKPMHERFDLFQPDEHTELWEVRAHDVDNALVEVRGAPEVTGGPAAKDLAHDVLVCG